jgi:MraZ protein
MWTWMPPAACWSRPNCAQAAGITKDAMLLGMGNHFELWDKATYDAQEAQAMQGEMPDVFKDFSF